MGSRFSTSNSHNLNYLFNKMFSKLTIGKSAVELAYIDSGVPGPSQLPYITIFAIHGMCFTSPIFDKVKRIAHARGVRFVAINRRNFPGSTPFTTEELDAIKSGDEEIKTAWMAARGHEIALFIDSFVQKHKLPPISDDGKSGGYAILAWSLGCPFAFSAISSADTLPADVRDRLAPRFRALIVHEPAPLALGLPSPPKNWSPLVETSIPQELRFKAFAQWITSYFEHGDLSKRDLDLLSYILPSTVRPPTIFNMSAAEIKDTVCDGENATVDLPFLINLKSQIKASYRKAFFDRAIDNLFPKLKISLVAGDLSPSWALAGLWAVQDDEKEFGSGKINFKFVHGVNHFMHWDDPELAVDVYFECIGA